MATTPSKSVETVPAPSEASALVSVDTTAVKFIEMIGQAARDPNVDIAKMERLYAMMKDMETTRAKRAFSDAMTLCQSEMPRLVRDGHNPETGSRYAKLDTAIQKITPIYTRHGFNISFKTAESKLPEHIKMIAIVKGHGHEEEHPAEIPYDYLGPKGGPNKTKVHGVGSSFSYARRYLLYLIFNIALEGEDRDGNQNRPQQKGPGTATVVTRNWFLDELKKQNLETQALAYAIDKAILMPDKGLPDWPLEKLPLNKSGFDKLFSDIKNHK